MSGNNEGSTPEFDAFLAAGEVEVGDSNLASQEDAGRKPSGNRAARRGPPKEAPAAAADDKGDDKGDDDGQGGEDEDDKNGVPGDEDGDEGDDQGGEDDGDEDGDEKPEKKRRQPSDRIRELSRRLREKDRTIEALSARMDAFEKGGLPNNSGGGNSASKETPAPDPTDTDKYPLGHLDDRYIEDKLEWLTEKKATERADAALHRQQENENRQAQQNAQQALLDKVDDLADRGLEIHDDYQELVVEAGMKGEWDLSQATFEACHEVDHGAQILYDLSQDKKEASRVAKLSARQQILYVEEKNAEIAKTKTPRRIPRAGEPPKNTARGANSRTQINPATDNLDDFEKAWEQDAKKGRR